MSCKQFNRPPIIPYFWHKNHYNWSELWRLGLLLQRSKKNPTDPGSPKLNMGAWKLNTIRFGGDETHPNTPIISWEYDDWRLGRVTVIASYLCIAVIYTQGLVGSSWTSGSLTILSSPNQQVSILPEKKRNARHNEHGCSEEQHTLFVRFSLFVHFHLFVWTLALEADSWSHYWFRNGATTKTCRM